MVAMIAPVEFFGAESVRLPPPPKVPVIEAVEAREGSWLMASQTTGTVPPPSRRK